MGTHASTVLCFALATLVASATVKAQGWPAKPVRVVVAQAAGSATDIVTRVMGNGLSDALGQPFVVDIRAGAGGLVGTEVAAKAVPDGYTMLMANISTHGVNPALHAKLSFDPVRDFAPISMVSTTANVLVVHPSLPVHTVKDFIALAKARPGQLAFATPGSGSSQHLATELLRFMAGNTAMLHVPYKGSGGAMASVIAGETVWMMPTVPLSLPHIRSKRVRPIAVSTSRPVDDLPGIPTIAETLPGYDVVTWYALMFPAGAPQPLVSRANAEIVKLLATADMQRALAVHGMQAQSSTPEQLGEFVKSEIARWTKVARQAGIRAD
jgi:tripartite-type tricarboxylate transporter receptor subunit TctC